ncbi:MAG: hypothetical protein U0457_11485 [Candidatus Sericytochromatia bacterium]
MSNKKTSLPKLKPDPKGKPEVKAKVESNNSMPSFGGEANSEYLKMFYPRPEVDMKWLYEMNLNVQGLSMKAELVMEVIEIANKQVKIRTLIGEQSVESEVSIDAFSPVPTPTGNNDKTGYIFEGNEDISVPAGDFRGCVKLSTSGEGGKIYLWLYKGTGPVKFSISANGVPADLLLKEFKN